jgi:hypothetical protein
VIQHQWQDDHAGCCRGKENTSHWRSRRKAFVCSRIEERYAVFARQSQSPPQSPCSGKSQSEKQEDNDRQSPELKGIQPRPKPLIHSSTKRHIDGDQDRQAVEAANPGLMAGCPLSQPLTRDLAEKEWQKEQHCNAANGGHV